MRRFWPLAIVSFCVLLPESFGAELSEAAVRKGMTEGLARWKARVLTAEALYRDRFVYPDAEKKGKWLWQRDDEHHRFLRGEMRRLQFRKRDNKGNLLRGITMRRGDEYLFWADYNSEGIPVISHVESGPKSPGQGSFDIGVAVPFSIRNVDVTALLSDKSFSIEAVKEVDDIGSLLQGASLIVHGDENTIHQRLDVADFEIALGDRLPPGTARMVDVQFDYAPSGRFADSLRGSGNIVFAPELDWAITHWEIDYWEKSDGNEIRTSADVCYSRELETEPVMKSFLQTTVSLTPGETEPHILGHAAYEYEKFSKSDADASFYSFESLGLPDVTKPPRNTWLKMIWFYSIAAGLIIFLALAIQRRRRSNVPA